MMIHGWKNMLFIKGVISEHEIDMDWFSNSFPSEGGLAIWKELAVG